MKPLILTLILAISTFSQTVEVPQKFVDRANQSFIEVKALRELDLARQAEIKAKDEQIRLQSLLIESLNQSIETRDEQIKALSALRCDTTSFFFGLIKKKSCK